MRQLPTVQALEQGKRASARLTSPVALVSVCPALEGSSRPQGRAFRVALPLATRDARCRSRPASLLRGSGAGPGRSCACGARNRILAVPVHRAQRLPSSTPRHASRGQFAVWFCVVPVSQQTGGELRLAGVGGRFAIAATRLSTRGARNGTGQPVPPHSPVPPQRRREAGPRARSRFAARGVVVVADPGDRALQLVELRPPERH